MALRRASPRTISCCSGVTAALEMSLVVDLREELRPSGAHDRRDAGRRVGSNG